MFLRQRPTWPGFLMVLLALSVQLGLGARVPQIDPLTQDLTAICHAASGNESDRPVAPHSTDCLLCPLCSLVHQASVWVMEDVVAIPRPVTWVSVRPELPPPSTAPPLPAKVVFQPRAPPVFS
jgi:hypothetical protein